MSWPTEPNLRARLADLLSQLDASLPPKWSSIITDSLAAAAGDVKASLLARGYTISQIDNWDRLDEFVIDIGLFWCLTKGGMLGNYSDLFIQKIDRRKELLTAPLLNNGALVNPSPNNANSPVASGRLSEDGYRFNMNTEF
jgi:hypothetical protein